MAMMRAGLLLMLPMVAGQFATEGDSAISLGKEGMAGDARTHREREREREEGRA